MKRYGMGFNELDGAAAYEDPEGEFYKYEEVKHLVEAEAFAEGDICIFKYDLWQKPKLKKRLMCDQSSLGEEEDPSPPETPVAIFCNGGFVKVGTVKDCFSNDDTFFICCVCEESFKLGTVAIPVFTKGSGVDGGNIVCTHCKVEGLESQLATAIVALRKYAIKNDWQLGNEVFSNDKDQFTESPGDGWEIAEEALNAIKPKEAK